MCLRLRGNACRMRRRCNQQREIGIRERVRYREFGVSQRAGIGLDGVGLVPG